MSEQEHRPGQEPDRTGTPDTGRTRGPVPSGISDHQGFTNAAWSIPSYILSGMAVYGGAGWGLDRWLGTSALFPIGILVGLGLALYLVYHRYGR